MRETRQISQAEEFHIIYVRYSTLKKMEPDSPLLKHGLWILSDFLPQNTVRKQGGGGRVIFTVEKTHSHHLSHPIKISINNEPSCWRYVPLVWCDRSHIHHCGFLPPRQTHNPSLFMIKKHPRDPSWGSQNCQSHQKLGKYETPS